jgi:hypothetical protein
MQHQRRYRQPRRGIQSPLGRQLAAVARGARLRVPEQGFTVATALIDAVRERGLRSRFAGT